MNLRKELGDLRLIVELFALAHLEFLALDIYVAHSMNAFLFLTVACAGTPTTP